MSDAPAKILMAAEPVTLTAGSRKSSTITFEVSDINDNPNPETAIQLWLLDKQGYHSDNGRLSHTVLYTDRNGQTKAVYTAGRDPGTVRIKTKISSRIPTPEELRRAQGTLFVPLWEEREDDGFDRGWGEELPDEEIGTLQEWYKMKGDDLHKGEMVARIVTDNCGDILIKAPYDGELIKIKVMAGEEVRLGQTIGFMDIEED
jgi:hypothetical protein